MSWIKEAKNGLKIHYTFAFFFFFGLRSRYTQRIDSVSRICGMSKSTLEFSFFCYNRHANEYYICTNCAFDDDRHAGNTFALHYPHTKFRHCNLYRTVDFLSDFVISQSERIWKWGICASLYDRPRGLCLSHPLYPHTKFHENWS